MSFGGYVVVTKRTERKCSQCQELNHHDEYITYKEPGPFIGTICRTCRNEAYNQQKQTGGKRKCTICQKLRKLNAYSEQPVDDNVPGAFQRNACNPCKNKIQRAWSKDRWEIDGFTRCRPFNGRSYILCNTCLHSMERKYAYSHKCVKEQ